MNTTEKTRQSRQQYVRKITKEYRVSEPTAATMISRSRKFRIPLADALAELRKEGKA